MILILWKVSAKRLWPLHNFLTDSYSIYVIMLLYQVVTGPPGEEGEQGPVGPIGPQGIKGNFLLHLYTYASSSNCLAQPLVN